MKANIAENNNQSTSENYVDYRARIDEVTSYIQSHINADLQLEQLAQLAGFSAFHFHRIFAALMGETVAEYVRRVRLAQAVQQLLHTSEPVTDIALAVGYETPAAFTKAFRQRFGIPPTQLRSIDRTEAFTLILKQPTARRRRGRQIKPEIRTLPDLRVLYARCTGLIEQNYSQAAHRAFDILVTYLYENSLMDICTACVGITPDDPNVVPHEHCRFDAGVVLKEGVQVQPSENIDIQVLPAGRWAVFQHKGPYDTLWQTWSAADRDWLPRSGETLRDVPPLELYLNNVHTTPPEKLRTEILIPIV